MDESPKNVIKRVYDEFIGSDFQYGTDSSTTLNPQREIIFDQVEIIKKRLQEVTDDIIRKKIVKDEPPEEPVRSSLSPGGLPAKNSLLRQAAQINTGSVGIKVLFPIVTGPNDNIQFLLEPMIGVFPSETLVDIFDHPLSLDCEAILKKYNFEPPNNAISGIDFDKKDPASITMNSDGTLSVGGGQDGFGGSSTGGGGSSGSSGSGGGGSGDSDNWGGDDYGEEEDYDIDDQGDMSEFEACAMIELTWLKIILILLRIIKILQIILDLILAILVPIFEIVMLALSCWLIPPNIEIIRQRLTEMILALIIMIITRLLALIFTLLNLDCICDITMDMIAQIRRAMSAFSSLLSIFRLDSVNLMFNSALDQIKDPLDQIKEMMEKREEAKKIVQGEFRNFSFKEAWNKSADEIKNGVVNELSTNSDIQKVQQVGMGIKSQIGSEITSIISEFRALTQSYRSEPNKSDFSDLIERVKNFDTWDGE